MYLIKRNFHFEVMSLFLRFNWLYIYFRKFDIEILFLFSVYPIIHSLTFMERKSVFSSSVFLSFMRSSLNGTQFRFGIQSSRAFFHLLMFSTFVCREIEAVWKCSAVMRPEKFPRLGCFANCTSLLYVIFVYVLLQIILLFSNIFIIPLPFYFFFLLIL